MAHWFHRNVFKATTLENFDLKMVALDTEALKICGLVFSQLLTIEWIV
jgi:hypothetical protein